MPGFPSRCAARTMARLRFFASVFWKMPRYTISTAYSWPMPHLRSQPLHQDRLDLLEVAAHGALGARRIVPLDRLEDPLVALEGASRPPRRLEGAGARLAQEPHQHVEHAPDDAVPRGERELVV